MSRTRRKAYDDYVWCTSVNVCNMRRFKKRHGISIRNSYWKDNDLYNRVQELLEDHLPLTAIYGKSCREIRSHRKRFRKLLFNRALRHRQNQLLRIHGEDFSGMTKYQRNLRFIYE